MWSTTIAPEIPQFTFLFCQTGRLIYCFGNNICFNAAIDWSIPHRPWSTIKFSNHSGYFSVSCVFHELVVSNLNFNLWSPTWILNNELKFKSVLYHNLDKKSDLEQTSTWTDSVSRKLWRRLRWRNFKKKYTRDRDHIAPEPTGCSNTKAGNPIPGSHLEIGR